MLAYNYKQSARTKVERNASHDIASHRIVSHSHRSSSTSVHEYAEDSASDVTPNQKQPFEKKRRKRKGATEERHATQAQQHTQETPTKSSTMTPGIIKLSTSAYPPPLHPAKKSQDY